MKTLFTLLASLFLGSFTAPAAELAATQRYVAATYGNSTNGVGNLLATQSWVAKYVASQTYLPTAIANVKAVSTNAIPGYAITLGFSWETNKAIRCTYSRLPEIPAGTSYAWSQSEQAYLGTNEIARLNAETVTPTNGESYVRLTAEGDDNSVYCSHVENNEIVLVRNANSQDYARFAQSLISDAERDADFAPYSNILTSACGDYTPNNCVCADVCTCANFPPYADLSIELTYQVLKNGVPTGTTVSCGAISVRGIPLTAEGKIDMSRATDWDYWFASPCNVTIGGITYDLTTVRDRGKKFRTNDLDTSWTDAIAKVLLIYQQRLDAAVCKCPHGHACSKRGFKADECVRGKDDKCHLPVSDTDATECGHDLGHDKKNYKFEIVDLVGTVNRLQSSDCQYCGNDECDSSQSKGGIAHTGYRCWFFGYQITGEGAKDYGKDMWDYGIAEDGSGWYCRPTSYYQGYHTCTCGRKNNEVHTFPDPPDGWEDNPDETITGQVLTDEGEWQDVTVKLVWLLCTKCSCPYPHTDMGDHVAGRDCIIVKADGGAYVIEENHLDETDTCKYTYADGTRCNCHYNNHILLSYLAGVTGLDVEEECKTCDNPNCTANNIGEIVFHTAITNYVAEGHVCQCGDVENGRHEPHTWAGAAATKEEIAALMAERDVEAFLVGEDYAAGDPNPAYDYCTSEKCGAYEAVDHEQGDACLDHRGVDCYCTLHTSYQAPTHDDKYESATRIYVDGSECYHRCDNVLCRLYLEIVHGGWKPLDGNNHVCSCPDQKREGHDIQGPTYVKKGDVLCERYWCDVCGYERVDPIEEPPAGGVPTNSCEHVYVKLDKHGSLVGAFTAFQKCTCQICGAQREHDYATLVHDDACKKCDYHTCANDSCTVSYVNSAPVYTVEPCGEKKRLDTDTHYFGLYHVGSTNVTTHVGSDGVTYADQHVCYGDSGLGGNRTEAHTVTNLDYYEAKVISVGNVTTSVCRVHQKCVTCEGVVDCLDYAHLFPTNETLVGIEKCRCTRCRAVVHTFFHNACAVPECSRCGYVDDPGVDGHLFADGACYCNCGYHHRGIADADCPLVCGVCGYPKETDRPLEDMFILKGMKSTYGESVRNFYSMSPLLRTCHNEICGKFRCACGRLQTDEAGNALDVPHAHDSETRCACNGIIAGKEDAETGEILPMTTATNVLETLTAEVTCGSDADLAAQGTYPAFHHGETSVNRCESCGVTYTQTTEAIQLVCDRCHGVDHEPIELNYVYDDHACGEPETNDWQCLDVDGAICCACNQATCQDPYGEHCGCEPCMAYLMGETVSDPCTCCGNTPGDPSHKVAVLEFTFEPLDLSQVTITRTNTTDSITDWSGATENWQCSDHLDISGDYRCYYGEGETVVVDQEYYGWESYITIMPTYGTTNVEINYSCSINSSNVEKTGKHEDVKKKYESQGPTTIPYEGHVKIIDVKL